MIAMEAYPAVGKVAADDAYGPASLILRRRDNDPPPQISPLLSAIGDRADEWWIARTRSRMQKSFAWDLLYAGIAYFLPLKQRRRKEQRSSRVVSVPVFPGYIFVNGFALNVDAPAVRFRIWRTEPIKNQKRFVEQATALHNEIIKQGESFDSHEIAEKSRCVVTRGAYRGQIGFVIPGNRAFVTLEIEGMGRKFPLELDRDDVEIA